MGHCENKGADVKVSVILPVYNVEKYVERAVHSILLQSFQDFEIILADDGATDGSGAVCDRLAASDDRIKVIHKENGGVASARNAALDIASGKYIYFMDPDDYALGELLAENISLAEKYNCDQVIFGFENEICDSEDNITDRKNYLHDIDGLYSYEEFKRIYKRHLEKVPHVVWNRIYSRQSIGDLRFSSEARIAEDAMFNMALINKGFGNVYYNNKIYYAYICRINSLMNRYNVDKLKYENMITDSIAKTVNNWGMKAEFDKFLAYRYIETMLFEYNNMTMHDCKLSNKEITEIIKLNYESDRIVNARKYIKARDIPYFSSRVTYILSNAGMYRLALYFRRVFTPFSKFAHKLVYNFRLKGKCGGR